MAKAWVDARQFGDEMLASKLSTITCTKPSVAWLRPAAVRSLVANFAAESLKRMIWRPSWTPSCIYSKECLNSETKAFIEFLGPQNHVLGSRITMISHILRELEPIQ